MIAQGIEQEIRGIVVEVLQVAFALLQVLIFQCVIYASIVDVGLLLGIEEVASCQAIGVFTRMEVIIKVDIRIVGLWG